MVNRWHFCSSHAAVAAFGWRLSVKKQQQKKTKKTKTHVKPLFTLFFGMKLAHLHFDTCLQMQGNNFLDTHHVFQIRETYSLHLSAWLILCWSHFVFAESKLTVRSYGNVWKWWTVKRCSAMNQTDGTFFMPFPFYQLPLTSRMTNTNPLCVISAEQWKNHLWFIPPVVLPCSYLSVHYLQRLKDIVVSFLLSTTNMTCFLVEHGFKTKAVRQPFFFTGVLMFEILPVWISDQILSLYLTLKIINDWVLLWVPKALKLPYYTYENS